MAEPIWYYAIDDQEHGPVTPAQLKAIAHSGQLLPTDLVWKQGLDDWKPARHVAGLFPYKAKASVWADNGNGQNQADTTDEPAHKAKLHDQAPQPTSTEPPPSEEEANVEQPPEAPFESPPPQRPEPDGEEIIFQEEAPEFDEPPVPPPMQPELPTGVPYSGEYRPQERMHRPRVTVGPVTLRLTRLTVVISLLLLVALQGCESLSASYAGRLGAISAAAEQDFLAQWEDRRSSLKSRRNALQEQSTRNSLEATELGRILDDLESLDSEMTRERLQLQDTEWLALDIAAKRAAADHLQWTWWLRLARLPLSLLLASGALVLSFFSEGQERWLGTGLALLMAAAMLLGGLPVGG